MLKVKLAALLAALIGLEVHYPSGKDVKDGKITAIEGITPTIVFDENGEAPISGQVTIQPTDGSEPVTVDSSQVFDTDEECVAYVQAHPDIFNTEE